LTTPYTGPRPPSCPSSSECTSCCLLLLTDFALDLLRFHSGVGADDPFSTSRMKKFFERRRLATVSIFWAESRPTDGRSNMTTDAMVLDVSKDWAIAAGVQQRFMQGWGPAIDTLDYSAGCRQALELGGDCYGFVPLADQRLAVTIGDGSGKGLAAALMISSVQSSLRTAVLLGGIDLASAFKVVNRQVHASSSADRYATTILWHFRRSNRHATVRQCRP
jgi:Stage II sporulation protein E (SpoIIE)